VNHADADTAALPLVTFILLTYNQERWVRAAVEGALGQDYPNLEIIVSDDCSSDRTFEILQEIKAGYAGPHTLVVRQTERNCGSLLHAADVAGIARGRLLVLAAGDDVSKSHRTRVLHDAWKKTGAWGLSSRFDSVDEEGLVLTEGVQADVIESHGFEKFFVAGSGPVRVVHGCTSAYDAQLFRHLHLDESDYILSEDGALSVLVNLLGKDIMHLEDSLVLYRQSASSLTNNTVRKVLTYADVVRDEKNIERFALSQANRCRLFLRMNEYLGEARVRSVSVPGVTEELRRQEVKMNWFALSPFTKVASLIHGWVEPRWALPRSFGRPTFYLLKSLASRLN